MRLPAYVVSLPEAQKAKAKAVSPRYNGPHRALRKRLAPAVNAGRVTCWRCERLILPGEPWDLGHAEHGRGWRGPEHEHCNRSAGGKRGRAIQLGRALRRRSRIW